MNARSLPGRRTLIKIALVGGALIGGGMLAAGGPAAAAGIAGTATAASPVTGGAAGVTDDSVVAPATAASSTESDVTGAALASVKAAVSAKYPGATFGRVTTEDGGGYEAHITTAAGAGLTVVLDKAFAVTGTTK